MAVTTYAIGMRTRFRGITERQGMIWRGTAGWAEWSPFLDYSGSEVVPWLRAAREAAEVGWPAPLRSEIEVNCTVPAVPPDQAYALVSAAGCRTAKVKVAEPGQALSEDLDRVEAVRSAIGDHGRIRVDANGAWDVDRAVLAIRELARFELEYVEQPCRDVPALAELRRTLSRRRLHVLIAADESIRRSEDPYRVAEEAAADIAVLKVQPLGGVRACLEIADRIGLPVVVSSAVETSVGLRAGVALAAALPELPYACGLNTLALLTDDVGSSPLVPEDGRLPVAEVEVEPAALARCAADPATDRLWQARLMDVSRLAAEIDG